MAGPVQEPHHISSDLPGSEGLPCPFFCKCAPPMPDPWRPPNACDDLLGLHPERTAFVKQQEAHFCARLCLATLRPRAIYGPGLLSNTLPHQTKFFSLHQPLPPLPIPEAHRYHRFTLVDLLEHELPEAKGEARSDEQGFFSSLAASAAGNSSGGCSNGGSTEKSAKATAATIAAFLLSAAPAAALGDHAFRKVHMQQQQLCQEQPAPPGSGSMLRSFSAQFARPQQLQHQHVSSSSSALGAAPSSVCSRRGRADSYVGSDAQRPQCIQQQQLLLQQQQLMLQQQHQYLKQQQLMLQQQQGGNVTLTRQEKRRKIKRRKVDDW
ncbi:auxin response factor 7 [Cyclospora cayetanensis]|uniref:Auxin response factor 7 n=1 Tax=Cyclospora cayetanensis TaxID=88456 RepID=A0A6P6RW41_9EIME|nr:auxin response factor 7 [Cyclospora cayetanensis]